MHSKLLALLAALAVGGTTGAVAFTSARGSSAPEDENTPPVTSVSTEAEPCTGAADPECVVVVPLPAPAQAPAAGPGDAGPGADAVLQPAPRTPVKLRGDGSVDDEHGGHDDDRSGRRGGDDRDRDDDRDDDEDRRGSDDDGSADEGSGDR